MKLRVGDKVYEFDQSRMMNVELNLIEREIGMTGMEWQDALNRGSSLAMTGLVWILERRYGPNPRVRFADIVFDPEEVDLLGEDGKPWTESVDPNKVMNEIEELGKSSTSGSIPASPEVMNGTALSSSTGLGSVPGKVTAWKPETS